MGKNRGKAPSNLTKYLLIARAAGRCQFCNEFLLIDSFTMTDNDDSNMAHIVASSPEGPRGDKIRSLLLSDNIDNLILMCRKHHKMIDANVDIYTEELLKELKMLKEKRVAEMGDCMKVDKTEIVIFQSLIKGKTKVNISLQQALKAIILKKTPLSPNGIVLDYVPVDNYHTDSYWKNASSYLCHKFNEIQSTLHYNPQVSFSVFPLAPIPLIIKLGYMFGDKISTNIYQKYRSPDTWSWITNKKTNSFFYNVEIISAGNNIAIIFALSSDIDVSRISSVCETNVIYKLSAKQRNVDCIKSEKDLSEFWHKYQEMCNEIKNMYPEVTDVSVFPSMPVSAAFVVGSHYMQGVYPKMHIYDEDDGFFKTITIGEKNVL